MSIRSLLLPLAVSLALTSAGHAAFKISETRNGSFGVYEVVDCDVAGARPKLMKAETGAIVYCIAAKPIVDKKHLKWATAGTNEAGTAYLSLKLTKEGGRIMEAASRRLLDEKEARGGSGEVRLAIVVNGKLFWAPYLRSVIKDELFVEGTYTESQMDKIADDLNRKKGEAYPAKNSGGDYSQ